MLVLLGLTAVGFFLLCELDDMFATLAEGMFRKIISVCYMFSFDVIGEEFNGVFPS